MVDSPEPVGARYPRAHTIYVARDETHRQRMIREWGGEGVLMREGVKIIVPGWCYRGHRFRRIFVTDDAIRPPRAYDWFCDFLTHLLPDGNIIYL
ncbi:hypothetical protein LAV_00002 [Sphingobium phage Lacusarx]|uniref:Uncharacterized protein n=1 Tax=Sphingobium phage Lacusarx TaxID=1980139 RepID=A0A1W6DXA1_9CAUD|nr:hypothetical protein FDH44_gp002 [Sphingobium phage Lacusarx]ARK07402.1 hypothetical protein LAV_00002 [Sphingobium phage Lacusarx]